MSQAICFFDTGVQERSSVTGCRLMTADSPRGLSARQRLRSIRVHKRLSQHLQQETEGSTTDQSKINPVIKITI